MTDKTVCMPIVVPCGDFCCGNEVFEICSYYDNYGGGKKCDLGFNLGDEDKEHRQPKPKGCIDLVEIK